MTFENNSSGSILLLVAGVKGAIGSTLAAAAHLMRQSPELVVPSLTTCGEFDLGPCPNLFVSGWDIDNRSIPQVLAAHGVLPRDLLQSVVDSLDHLPLKPGPHKNMLFSRQVEKLMDDMAEISGRFHGAKPVLVNLLPAGIKMKQPLPKNVNALNDQVDPGLFPDLPYVLAAIKMKIPVINFTPNEVELPLLISESETHGIPLAGRDGKTGQTYFKVVMASALKARGLTVDGWYSLNILGNADGENLMDPDRAAGKVANKTALLDTVLGYQVGQKYGTCTHQVRIDYYPPRRDAKEAWDVIDFSGLFGLPMSMRLNLQGRDSILAAPMVIDLARWLIALQDIGRSGLIPELSLYFKVPIGDNPPVTFQEQVQALEKLREKLKTKGQRLRTVEKAYN
jgi:myo-inositol-1-phosphate synthase